VDFKKDYLSAVDRKHQLFRDGRQKHREMVAQQASGSGQEAEPRFQLSYLYRYRLNPANSQLCQPKKGLSHLKLWEQNHNGNGLTEQDKV